MRISVSQARNVWLQAVLLGVGLFAISLIVRALSDTIVGGISAGPATPEEVTAARDTFSRAAYSVLLGVLLPALVETPLVVWLVRRAPRDVPTAGLAFVLTIVFLFAWLFHGASPGALGQACAFALLGCASWGWGKRVRRLYAYTLPVLSHAVWNGVGVLIFLLRAPS